MYDSPPDTMTNSERALAARAIRRKQLFRTLSNVSIAVAVLLAIVYGFERLRDPSFSIAPRAVIILLILLNARQNLRQHKYAVILEKLQPASGFGLPPSAEHCAKSRAEVRGPKHEARSG